MRIFLSVFVATTIAGCHDSRGLQAVSVPTGPVADACRAYAQIDRNRETTCYGVAPEPDEDALISRQIEACVLTTSAPGSEVSAAYWQGCAALADNACGGYQCATYPLGSVSVGAACLVSTQCASLFCKGTVVFAGGGTVLTNSLTCGVCTARLDEGDACDVKSDACQVGFSCFAGQCRARGGMGATCATAGDCLFPSNSCRHGVCDTPLSDGDNCEQSSDCGTDSRCDLTSKTCAPTQFAQPGNTCDGAVHDCETGQCVSASHTCAARLEDGAACDTNDLTHVCEIYARCFNGKCQIPDPASCH